MIGRAVATIVVVLVGMVFLFARPFTSSIIMIAACLAGCLPWIGFVRDEVPRRRFVAMAVIALLVAIASWLAIDLPNALRIQRRLENPSVTDKVN